MALNNYQESLVLTQAISLTGMFPQRPDDFSTGGDAGILAEIRTFAFHLNDDHQSPSAEGQVLAINSNTALFSLIGTQYGGDGRTTFHLPDLAGRVVVGTDLDYPGMVSGSGASTLNGSQLPATLGGSSAAIDNVQPSLTITMAIRATDPGYNASADVIGGILQFAGSFVPAGYIPADGRTVSRLDYPDLFDAIGYTYGGSGDFFNVPDLTGKTIIGASTETPLGTTVGQSTVSLARGEMPAQAGGTGQTYDNRQPSVAMHYIISLEGIYPYEGYNEQGTVLGEVVAFAGDVSQIPDGWILADGRALSIQMNQALFSLLGTQFGGDGVTWFALPDLRDRAVIGSGEDNGHTFTVGQTLGTNDGTVQMSDIPAVHIEGTNGADHYYGSNQADTINGHDGGDTLAGNGGNDVLTGGAGDDSIDAGAGDDSIDGGAGNNTLKGGSGADIFTVGAGTDVIVDFNLAEDRLDGAFAATIRSLADLQALVVDPANTTDAILDLGNGATVTLQGVDWRSLTLDNLVGVNDDAPIVTSVSVPANGIYKAGQNLDFTVNLSEAVLVDTSGGTPGFAVTVGTDTVYATYVSGSGTSALLFRVTLVDGLQDADGISVSGAIDLNGATLQDAAGNEIVPTLNSVGATTGVLVDSVRPTATIAIADTVLAPLETTTVTITFSEAVTGLSIDDFAVANGTLSGLASADGGVTWTATLTVDLVTDPTNIIVLDTAGVTDLAGNAGSGLTVSVNYAIEGGAPENVPPTLTGDLSATVKEGGSYEITTADLNFADADDSAAGVRFTVSALSNGKVYVDGKVATSFTGAELAAGKVSFVHSGAESTKASFKVSVEDGDEDGSIPATSTFDLTVSPVNDAPQLTGDLKATVKEGGSYEITTADLNVSDADDSAAGVRFTVSALSNGKVYVDGKVATSFTGAELAAGKVSLVHSGAESTKASFKVSVEDGDEDGSPPASSTFDLTVSPVNDAPKLTGDLKATVKEGGSYKLTTADLNVSDTDDSAANVRFTVSALSNGKVYVDGKVATSFTGTELTDGKVSFHHTGSETTKASFKVSVEDGDEDGSTPVAKTFGLTVTPVNDAPVLVASQILSQIAEDASTGAARKVATLSISDPDGGSNAFSLAGSDADLFEIRSGALWLKKGAKLDYETDRSLDVTVRLDDPSIGTGHEDWKSFKVAVKDVDDVKNGSTGGDTIKGTSGSDILDGKGGNDVISGGAGNDRLIGGSGVDTLTGGSGRDTFVFASVKDSAPGQSGLINNGGYNPLSGNDKRDVIADFVHAQDKLDLSAIDADSGRSGDQDFVWRGRNDFTGKAGELIFRSFDEKGTANDRTIVYADTDRDQRADFQIELAGVIGLTKGDFIL